MPLAFDGTGDRVTFSAGAYSGGGALSQAWLIYFDSLASSKSISTHNSVTPIQFAVDSSGVLNVRRATTGRAATTVLSASKWYILGFSKATGTTTPRVHIYDVTAGTWVHEDCAGALANGNPGGIRVGITSASYNDLAGSVAIGAGWDAALSDGEFEVLAPSVQAWIGGGVTAPACVWVFDQDATTQTIADLTGGGANESARSGNPTVSALSSPIPWGGVPVYTHETAPSVNVSGVTATATAAGLAGTVAAIRVTAISGAVAPATASGVAGSVSAGVTVSVSGSTATASAVGVAGSVTATLQVSVTGVTATATASGVAGTAATVRIVNIGGATSTASAAGVAGAVTARRVVTVSGVTATATAEGLAGAIAAGGTNAAITGATGSASAAGVAGSVAAVRVVVIGGEAATASASGVSGTATGAIAIIVSGSTATANAAGVSGVVTIFVSVSISGVAATATAQGYAGLPLLLFAIASAGSYAPTQSSSGRAGHTPSADGSYVPTLMGAGMAGYTPSSDGSYSTAITSRGG